MPKFEPKIIQKEIEQKKFRPVYWMVGPERLKAMELTARIQSAFESTKVNIEGSEWGWAQILDEAMSPSLLFGKRVLVVQNAQAIKDSENLIDLCQSDSGQDGWGFDTITVFWAKELDARKKSTKLWVERAAIVNCDEVAESDREAWISFLARRRGILIGQQISAQLRVLDPWSLEMIEQELTKIELLGSQNAELYDEVLAGGAAHVTSEKWLEGFLVRDKNRAIQALPEIVSDPELAIPLLGLLAWNVRYLSIMAADPGAISTLKLSPFVLERLKRFLKYWKLPDLMSLQSAICELDFDQKQKPLHPLGLWGCLVNDFAH